MRRQRFVPQKTLLEHNLERGKCLVLLDGLDEVPLLSRCCRELSLSSIDFCTEMIETAGLLSEKEIGRYEFTHQTFQEYFAALYLKEMGQIGLNKLIRQLDNDRWQEVVCFYVALSDADPIITTLLNNPTDRNLQLANRCKNEARDLSPGIIERLNQLLQEASIVNAEIRLEQRFLNLRSTGNSSISELITWGEYYLFLADQATKQFHSKALIRSIDPREEAQPVTEINQEDKLWFCAWLSKQENLRSENTLYDYRLPNLEEIEKVFAGSKTEKIRQSNRYLVVVREEIPSRYERLFAYLTNNLWAEADWETERIMLKIVNKQNRYLTLKDIEQFPCEALRTIDQLWFKFSGGRFSFSVQREIYKNLGFDKRYEETTKRFEEIEQTNTGTPNSFPLPKGKRNYEDLYSDFALSVGWKRGRW